MRSDRSLGPDPAGPHRLWQRMGFQSKRSGICWRVSAVMRIQVIFLAAVMWSGGGGFYTQGLQQGKKLASYYTVQVREAGSLGWDRGRQGGKK